MTSSSLEGKGFSHVLGGGGRAAVPTGRQALHWSLRQPLGTGAGPSWPGRAPLAGRGHVHGLAGWEQDVTSSGGWAPAPAGRCTASRMSPVTVDFPEPRCGSFSACLSRNVSLVGGPPSLCSWLSWLEHSVHFTGPCFSHCFLQVSGFLCARVHVLKQLLLSLLPEGPPGCASTCSWPTAGIKARAVWPFIFQVSMDLMQGAFPPSLPCFLKKCFY